MGNTKVSEVLLGSEHCAAVLSSALRSKAVGLHGSFLGDLTD